MLAERSVTCGEAAKVDDSTNIRAARRVAEIPGRDTILFEVVAVGAHRVNEVVGDVDAGQGAIERRRIEEIARDNFGGRRDARLERFGMPGEAAKPDA